MFKNPLNLLGFILIIVALALGTLPFINSKSFKRQDILLIIAYLISGIIFFNQKWYRQELTQVNIILLTITALAYTVESLRLTMKTKK
ncbi:MAG: Ycf66 family protein [Cyanobacteria bacterium P01_D01_bin.116]